MHDATAFSPTPASPGWAHYVAPIKVPGSTLAFNADSYPEFDGIVQSSLGTLHPGLRVNLAALRHFFRAHAASHQQAIAKAIAAQIQKGAIDIDIASIEGIGAQEIYHHLLALEQGSKSIFKRNVFAWGLPPLDATPFSTQQLSAPANSASAGGDALERLRSLDELVKDEKQSQTISDPVQHQDPVAASLVISEGMIATANKLRSVDTLAEVPRKESVEEARIILRWLRNMQFADRDLEEFLDQGTPPAIVSKKDGMRKLTDIFAAHLMHMKATNPGLAGSDAAIRNACDAVDAMALEVAEHTRNLAPDDSAEETRLNQLIDSLPDSAKMRQNQSLEQLLDTMEMGLARLTGRTVEMTSFARLLSANERLHIASQQLKSPQEMEEPSREESIDLAREILRRLQNMDFGSHTLAEFIERGLPEEKAMFAQQVGEIVGIYRNLLIEAAQSNPGVHELPAMKEVADALNTFTHSVKLMAAKEIPLSVASSMQISSESAADPAEWKNMQSQTVDRIMQSANKALEKAVEELQQQVQKAQEQAEEQGQDAAEQAAQQAAQAKEKEKKKKKRKGDSKPRSSGKGGRRSRKAQQEMTADDRALKQGAFAEEAKPERAEGTGKSSTGSSSRSSEGRSSSGTGRSSQSTSPAPTISPPRNLPGVNPADLQAIMQLGNSLRSVSNQLKDIGVTATNVSHNDKLAPDDKSVVQRVLEREEQKKNPTKGNQGPGV